MSLSCIAVGALSKLQEQHEGVSVGRHGACAQGALLGQVIGEECLYQGGEARS
jgi:hypothetical protein